MPQYRKKPVVISAEQWFPGRAVVGVSVYGEDAEIWTLEGVMKVSPGDFIITGVKGEKCACKPDVFALTYEEV